MAITIDLNHEFDANRARPKKPRANRSPNGTNRKRKATGPGTGKLDRSHGPDGLIERQRIFLECYVVAPSLNRAVRLAEERGVPIPRSQPGKWSKDNESFRRAFQKAKKQALRYLEEEARRRAVEGIRKKKFYKGEPIIDPVTGNQYEETEYSDAMLMFLLKCQLPEKYGDKSKLELSGSLDLTNINEAELEERERRLGLIPQRFILPTAETQAN